MIKWCGGCLNDLIWSLTPLAKVTKRLNGYDVSLVFVDEAAELPNDTYQAGGKEAKSLVSVWANIKALDSKFIFPDWLLKCCASACLWVPLCSRSYVAPNGPLLRAMRMSPWVFYSNVCTCVCAFSTVVNYGLLLAPVTLSLPHHFKADVEVGVRLVVEGCRVGADKARSALSRQHVPLYSQWGLAVCGAACFGSGSSSTDGLQSGEICCLPPRHCQRAHSHQVEHACSQFNLKPNLIQLVPKACVK